MTARVGDLCDMLAWVLRLRRAEVARLTNKCRILKCRILNGSRGRS